MSKTKAVTALVVRDIKTREEVHRVDVKGLPERRIEKALMGMLMRVDTDRFFVDEEES